MAQVLRQSGGQMREEGQGQQVASFADSAADQIERLGGYLEQTSGNELLRDVEQFARRRPWIVAGFGLVAGLAGSRFLKAWSERRYGSRQGSSDVVRQSHATASPRGYGGEPVCYRELRHERVSGWRATRTKTRNCVSGPAG